MLLGGGRGDLGRGIRLAWGWGGGLLRLVGHRSTTAGRRSSAYFGWLVADGAWR